MKTTKRILAMLLVMFMLAATLVSCGKDKGEIMAVYNGDEYIYENDTDYSDFFMMKSYEYVSTTGNTTLSGDDYNSIVEESIKETIVWREMNAQFKELGYFVDEESVKEAALADAKYFDASYTGGYSAFLESWNLSEDAFTMFNKYDAMLEMAAEKIMNVTKPTEEEAHDYYMDYSYNYVVKPHYSVSTIVLQVTDTVSKDDALADAKSYIEMLQSGRTWEEVKMAASIKYNIENGMIYSQYLTGEEKLYLESFEEINDLDATIAAIDADFKAENGVSYDEMFPNGFEAYAKSNGLTEGSDAYNKAEKIHYDYTAKVYNAQYAYIITTAWEDGKTYSEPLWHGGMNCYAIVTFNSIVDKSGFMAFDEVKDEIIEEMFEAEKENAINKYISNIYNRAMYGMEN